MLYWGCARYYIRNACIVHLQVGWFGSVVLTLMYCALCFLLQEAEPQEDRAWKRTLSILGWSIGLSTEKAAKTSQSWQTTWRPQWKSAAIRWMGASRAACVWRGAPVYKSTFMSMLLQHIPLKMFVSLRITGEGTCNCRLILNWFTQIPQIRDTLQQLKERDVLPGTYLVHFQSQGLWPCCSLSSGSIHSPCLNITVCAHCNSYVFL